jgi:hypothetical protein
MLQNRPVTLRSLTPITALALLAAASPARAACLAARGGPSVGGLNSTWKTAVEQLLRSTSEPGHPWSCVGGVVDLEVASSGAVLRVAREGEEAVARRVESPDDVVPLGQALLATPLPPPPPESVASAPPASAKQAPASAVTPAPASAPPEQPSVRPSRLLVGGGVDVHHVGGSRVAWVGPVVSAAVPMGRLLPGISVRYQSSVLSRRPPIDEVSVAVSVQSRFVLSAVELRAGLVLRGATVQRDLPRPQGDQGRLEGRVGAITSLVIPAFRWGRVVLSADAEAVGAVRERDTQVPPGVDPPRPYPRYLLGGGAQIEVPL